MKADAVYLRHILDAVTRIEAYTSVGRERFSVMLIPHTLAMTTLGIKQTGDAVNIETDMIARHVAKLMDAMKSAS